MFRGRGSRQPSPSSLTTDPVQGLTGVPVSASLSSLNTTDHCHRPALVLYRVCLPSGIPLPILACWAAYSPFQSPLPFSPHVLLIPSSSEPSTSSLALEISGHHLPPPRYCRMEAASFQCQAGCCPRSPCGALTASSSTGPVTLL